MRATSDGWLWDHESTECGSDVLMLDYCLLALGNTVAL